MLCAAEEHLAELMPIFEELRAKGEVGNAYPMHVGSTSGPTVHMAHANPNTCHWVIFSSSLLHFYFVVVVYGEGVRFVVIIISCAWLS